MNERAVRFRSLLFAPGSEERKVSRLGDFDADAVVLDLEDAVADSEKASAREIVTRALLGLGKKECRVGVRINALPTGLAADDITSAVSPRLDFLVVPKVEDKETLSAVDSMVSLAEKDASIPRGSVRLLALIETARGLSRCEAILDAAPSRLQAVIFGSGDFTVDLGISLGRDGSELHYARSRVVVAARAAGMSPPFDGPYLDISDDEGLWEDTLRSRRLGFAGRVVVHPGQVKTVNAAYAHLEPEEEEFFRHVVDGFERAEQAGLASLRIDGRFVDYPIYRLAKARLSARGN